MQKRFLPCLLLIMVVLSSCGFYEHKEKLLLCQNITATHDTLDKMTRVWHQLLDRGVRVKNFAGLEPYRTKMGEFVARRRIVNADLELVPPASSLRDSEETFLAARALMISDNYPGFEQFNEFTPQQSVVNQLRLVADDLQSELAGSAAMKRSVQVFIQRNNLRMPK